MALAKVGVIGSGSVGSKLGARLLAKGYKVTYSSRDPSSDKNKQLLAEQPTAAVDTVANVVAASDVLILATPGATSDDGIKSLAASLGSDVQGKVLLDATNPLSGYPGLEVRWAEGKSGGEVLAEALPGAFVYKAFNTIGAEHMSQPDGSAITGERLSMLFAGPEEKQAAAAAIIDAVGFASAYVGPIRYARNLEAIAELWIHLGVPGVGSAAKWGRNFHFQVIKKD